MEKETVNHQKEHSSKESLITVIVTVLGIGLFLLSFVPSLLWFFGNRENGLIRGQVTPTPTPVPPVVRKLDSKTFPDEAFRDYLSEHVDLNGDGQLDSEEYEEVTELHLSGLGIQSLEGISKFYYLKVLECKDNELTSLDLSHNPRLVTLDCSNNSLTELDLTRVKRLENLTVDPEVKVIRSEEKID